MNDSYLVLENFPFTFPSLNIIRHKKKKEIGPSILYIKIVLCKSKSN